MQLRATLLLLVAAAASVFARSQATTYTCPVADTFGSPLCTADYTGSAPAMAGEFICYYSQGPDSSGCVAADYCIYNNLNGSLEKTDDNSYCPTPFPGCRIRVRSLVVAKPSPAQTLRKRVDTLRSRAARLTTHPKIIKKLA